MAKVIRDTTFIGEGGIAVVQRILMGMRYAWQPTGRFDAGIDGYIELRDRQTMEMLGAHLGAQVKTRATFTRETDASFEFLCDREDIDYWMHSNVPVILICVRSDAEEAWFVCVTEYFTDPDACAERRVVFDKARDRFDVGAADALRDLALPLDAGIPRQGLTGPETLLTNLLPVQYGSELFAATATCVTREEVHARYEQVGGTRASDYLMRDGRLYSLRDPRTCSLQHICDVSTLELLDIRDWANSDERNVQHRFADLLRRTLLHQVKARINWQPDKALFYFATQDGDSVSMTGPTGRSRQVVAVKTFIGDDGQERIGHMRHLAFIPRFIRLDAKWYLEVTPEWYFSWDGEREDRKADERRRWLKSKERNSSVTGQLRFIEHVLCGQMSAFGDPEVPLRFGPLRIERVAVGIDDKAWQGSKPKKRPAKKAAKGAGR